MIQASLYGRNISAMSMGRLKTLADGIANRANHPVDVMEVTGPDGTRFRLTRRNRPGQRGKWR